MTQLGFIPYGEGDDNLIFRNPLTSELTTSNMPFSGRLLQGSGLVPLHDPVKGMIAKDVNGADAGYRFTPPTGDMATFNRSGQGSISVEIEKHAVRYGDGSQSHDFLPAGYYPANSQTLLSGITSSGGSHGDLGIASNQVINMSLIHSGNRDARNYVLGAATKYVRAYDVDLPDFVRMEVFWHGGRTYTCLDNILTGILDGTSSNMYHTTLYNYMYIGSDRGGANTFLNGAYFRNLQFLNKAPIFARKPGHGKIVIWGDSLTDNGDSQTGIHSIAFRIMKRFISLGYWVNVEVSETAGANIHDTGGTYFGDQREAVVAMAPNHIYCQGGTNDAGNSVSDTDFRDSYRSHIEYMLGVNGETNKGISTFTCATIPSRFGFSSDADYANDEARTLALNSVINDLPGWWDETYPSESGRVFVHDQYINLGANNPSSYIFNGQVSGLYDDLHLAIRGLNRYGEGGADHYQQNIFGRSF